MHIARVIGNVVATVRHPVYDRHKLLLVQPLGLDGADRGRSSAPSSSA
jgi:microcompartment protein CcmK/EutM